MSKASLDPSGDKTQPTPIIRKIKVMITLKSVGISYPNIQML
jgi:hypothetical protein